MNKKSGKLNIIVSVVMFALVIALTVAVSLSALRGTTEEGVEALKANLERAVVECYALEGAYPPSLQYIEDNYGIAVNEQRYFVNYSFTASNLRPVITVIERGK